MNEPSRHRVFRGMPYWADRKGFTIVELLIVIAIIGILTAIAIPMFLGHREKAKIRSVVASAKGAVAETQSILDAYVVGDPFILLNASGQQVCYEAQNAPVTKRCQNVYIGMTATATYATPPNGISSIRQWLIDNHEGKEEISPYGAYRMFKAVATGNPGEVIITNQNGALAADRKLWIIGYASDTTNPIFNTTVTAR